VDRGDDAGMEVSFKDWLQAQIAREDSVGKIARSWVELGLQKLASHLPVPSWWDSEGVIKFHEEDYHLARRGFEGSRGWYQSRSFPSALGNKGVVETFDKGDWHSKNPENTSAEYRWMRHRDLWAFVKSQKALCLDAGYWIGTRMALSHKRTGFLHLLVDGAQCGEWRGESNGVVFGSAETV